MKDQTKKEMREQLKKDIEKFISNGGEVIQVETKRVQIQSQKSIK